MRVGLKTFGGWDLGFDDDHEDDVQMMMMMMLKCIELLLTCGCRCRVLKQQRIQELTDCLLQIDENIEILSDIMASISQMTCNTLR